jgi:hypothetical protein
MADDTPDALQALGHQPQPVLKAIRTKCLDCSGGSHSEVADCVVRACALYPFRMGTNPWRAPPTEAKREAARRIAARREKGRSNRGSAATDAWTGTTLPDWADMP